MYNAEVCTHMLHYCSVHALNRVLYSVQCTLTAPLIPDGVISSGLLYFATNVESTFSFMDFNKDVDVI